jgi:hypothetical protein
MVDAPMKKAPASGQRDQVDCVKDFRGSFDPARCTDRHQQTLTKFAVTRTTEASNNFTGV